MVRRELIIELDDGSTVMDLINKLVKMYGKPLKEILLDKDGRLSDSMTILLNRIEIKRK